jgi:hypothetical protein
MEDALNNSLTNSAATCWRTCRRKYLYRYERPIEPITQSRSHALRFGSLYHAGLEEWFRSRDLVRVERLLQAQCAGREHEDESLIAYHMARMMIEGYVLRWAREDERIACCAPEVDFKVPIVNPRTGRASRRFTHRGKLDLPLLDTAGQVVLMEHKTAVAVDGHYLSKLWSDSQITGYTAALRDMGFDVREVVYDVVRKPGIKLGKNESVDDYARRLAELYVYGISAGKCKRRKAETDDEWWARRRADGVPVDMYFREQVIIGDRQIEEWRADLWDVTQEILWARQHGRWPRSTARCHDWHRVCEYAPICQALGNEELIIQNEYQPRERHEELDGDNETTPF